MDILTRSMIFTFVFVSTFAIVVTILDKIAERKERKKKDEKEKEE